MLTFLPAVEMAAAVRARRVSPVDLIEAHLERIRALNPRLNAFVAVDADRARRDAAAAERAVVAGERLGPLHGVPVSVKGSIAVQGMPWDCGTRFRAGVKADADAPLVARLRAAGAIVLGVTNVAEQLMAWESVNLLHGRTNSPWDETRTPGGSSGGEAAAICAGLSAGGVGSDGGGSIRVPAHFTGICGLKPTPGRVPATGHFPPCGGPFALLGVVGPMARTVDDVCLLLEAIAGPDAGDPNGHPVLLLKRGLTPESPERGLTPVGSPGGQTPPDQRGLTPLMGGQTALVTRVAVFEDDGRTPVTPEIRRAVRAAAAALAAAGVEIVEWRPDVLDEARQLWWDIFGRASRLLLEPAIEARRADCHPNLHEFLDWTRRDPLLTAEELLAVEFARDVLRGRLLAQMERTPVLLCPVAAVPAFRHGEREWIVEGRRVHYLDAWSYSACFNLLQNPAVSVPAGLSDNGLPIGVQVVARPWHEMEALGVAKVVEQALGGCVPPPI
jgi:Asp-tRNA(Asn)/Glu-tRNA(Gln) amidotransferase A subunit family amidase